VVSDAAGSDAVLSDSAAGSDAVLSGTDARCTDAISSSSSSSETRLQTERGKAT